MEVHKLYQVHYRILLLFKTRLFAHLQVVKLLLMMELPVQAPQQLDGSLVHIIPEQETLI